MSPEYAMEGLYSIKSDVFSYGVLTLEIISGKRNNYRHVGSLSLNLIGYVSKSLNLIELHPSGNCPKDKNSIYCRYGTYGWMAKPWM
jgi:hypothetical protein